jgi:hypothetical protein
METNTTLTPNYVTGLLESAGSFTFNRGKQQLTVVFGVRSRATNRPLVEDLRTFFGDIGKIYDTTRNSCFFRVNRPRELLRIVEHFDEYPLRGNKRNAFRIWREMVLLRATHAGSRAPGELSALAEQLSQARADTSEKST